MLSHRQHTGCPCPENRVTSTVASPPPCCFPWGYEPHLAWLILQRLLEKRSAQGCVRVHASATIQPQLLKGPPGPRSFASQRGCDPCHPHKGLQLPPVCGEMGVGFGKDGPLFLSSSANGKPEPQRERLSCSKAFRRFLPERAAPCWLPADGGAQEPQLLLASLASHTAPGWRQHTEHQGADGHTTGQHHPCPPIPPQALGSLQNAAARCPLYPPLAIPGNFGWLLWCQRSSAWAAVVPQNQPVWT